MLLSGSFGFALAALAFVAALVATAGYGFSLRGGADERGWRRIGRAAFLTHAGALTGVTGVLLGLIFTRQYEYHYVWSHASNELPAHFMLASLWEGQEGSFLIWMFWHALLGSIVLWRAPVAWRPAVMAVVSSVQVILGSMTLGVYLSEVVVYVLMSALILAPAAWLLWQHRHAPRAASPRTLAIGAGVLAVLVLTNLFRQQTGYLGASFHPGFSLELAYMALVGGYGIREFKFGRLPFRSFAVLLMLVALALVAALVPIDTWKVGSSPFLSLRAAFPNDPVLTENPGFVPSNGQGLNPLLQNYWMVIHPPTLFLGFAATLIPFAYVLAGLLKADYSGWVKPALPWTIFASLVLGVGIIMGGYWAYETLSFGGYWAWDPVENASFVPWLTAVGGLHALLAWRTGKANLRLGMLLLAASFILVLYSTFLTRSGILGESSVHSFTDLGLSGQLLVLLFVYIGVVALLFVRHWRHLPRRKPSNTGWTRDLLLSLASMILLFAAIEIALVTSLPVINKLFGTSLAPPADTTRFYYTWNVWFGIAVAILSGVGQFFFWLRKEHVSRSQAMFRPFLTALIAAAGITLVLFWADWTFVHQPAYLETLKTTWEQGSWLDIGLITIGNGLMLLADELLLAAGLFAVLANLDMMLRLLKHNRSHWKRLGGSLAHTGFALMLVGILFSSGYEDTISVNMAPGELGSQFPGEEKTDNVLVPMREPRPIDGYRVTYLSRNAPEGPVESIRVIQREEGLLKVGFRDARGERYSVFLNEASFLKQPPAQGKASTAPLDRSKLRRIVRRDFRYMNPQLMNERTIYRLAFQSLTDSSERFIVEPETERSGEENIITHPDRQIRWNEDLYVHVTSIPSEASYRTLKEELKIDARGREVKQLEPGLWVKVDSLVALSENPQFQQFDLVGRVKLSIRQGGRHYAANPMFVIDGKRFRTVPSEVNALGLRFGVRGLQPDDDRIVLEVERRNDYVTIKAIRKPYINLLWLGTFLLAGGFGLALFRRIRER